MKEITGIIQIIYDEVKQLEHISIPNQKENLYEAVGELSECLFFQNGAEAISIDHIKVRLFCIYLSMHSIQHIFYFLCRWLTTFFCFYNLNTYCGYV